MNAKDAIDARLRERLWQQRRSQDLRRGIKVVWTDTAQLKLTVHYRLFGGLGGRRLCRFYGYDDDRYINWGVERAYIHRLTTGEVPQRWVPEFEFVGKNKKRQILAWLKDH